MLLYYMPINAVILIRAAHLLGKISEYLQMSMCPQNELNFKTQILKHCEWVHLLNMEVRLISWSWWLAHVESFFLLLYI